jgi:RNA polymerase sigma factor (sigma-70 family)
MQAQLNQIETRWPLVRRAHLERDASESARRQLLDRYSGPARRYLQALIRDDTLAEDLFQEFALRLIRGDFHRAAPRKGRFRDYLKGVLVNLAKDEYRRRKQQPAPLPEQIPDRAPALPNDSPQDSALERCREDLLHRTWQTLQESHAVFFAVLQVQAAQPETPAGEKAAQLSRLLNEPVTAGRFRVLLHRARRKFAALLECHAAASLSDPSEIALQSELRRLRLLRYCRE